MDEFPRRLVKVRALKSHDSYEAGREYITGMDGALAWLIVGGYFQLLEDPWQPEPASPSTAP